MIPVPVAFTEACRAMERGELALALMHCDRLRKDHPGCAEPAVLSAFIHRRAEQASESWLESLLASWESCGRPTEFTFLAGVSLEDQVEALADAPNPTEALANLLKDSVGIAANLWMLNSPAVLLEGALTQLTSPFDTLGRLFTAGQLGAVEREHALKDRAASLRTSVLREIADANPATFELSALPIAAEVKRAERLQPGHVGLLLAAMSMDTHPDLISQLYGQLVSQRRADSAIARRMAWLDVIAVAPDTSFTVWRFGKSAERTPDLLRLARELGERDAASRHILRRLIGLELLRLATSQADIAAVEDIRSRLAATRKLTREAERFDPGWPIDPLLVEVTDAFARDEVGLLTRCMFPESDNQKTGAAL